MIFDGANHPLGTLLEEEKIPVNLRKPEYLEAPDARTKGRVKLIAAVTLYELVEGDDGVKSRFPREVPAGQLVTVEEAKSAGLKEGIHFVAEWDEDQRLREEVGGRYEPIDQGWYGELPEGLSDVFKNPAELERMAKWKPSPRKR
jgi:hypothetical protein